MLLGQYPEENSDAKERKTKILKYTFEETNPEAALILLEKRDRLEKAILLSLRKYPNGYYNAFQNISRNTRFIYVHAYQSYVWNRTVSERLKRFGTKVLIGDLVSKSKDIA